MKLKKLFLCFVLMISCICMVSCKKDNNENNNGGEVQKQDPLISVTISKDTHYVCDKLKYIDLLTIGNCTEGSLEWENPEYELVFGENNCKWIFTPSDTAKYNSKSGFLLITAERELITPEVNGVKIKEQSSIYIDAPYSTVELECVSNVEGTIAWREPNKFLKAGENVCTWVFTPTEAETYSKVYGELTLSATQEQYLASISVKSNTKASGYRAFDKFDCSGLTLNLIYNAGKVVPVTDVQDDCSVGYLTGDCLHKGDTKVNVSYKGKTCEVEIDEVDYKLISVPEFTDVVVYNGTSRELKVENSYYYSFEPLNKIDAGEYDLVVTLTDTENCIWANGDEVTTVVKCQIQKAELTVTTNMFIGEYDGLEHYSTVTSSNSSTVYYSATELNQDNYLNASTSPVPFVNAGEFVSYYYAIGDENHSNLAGTVGIEITKQTPTLNLQNCYTLSTGKAIEYPSKFATVVSKQGVTIPTGTLKLTYYTAYSDDGDSTNDVLTTTASGASKEGGAPSNESENEYYVVVEYVGDNQNFESAWAFTTLYIDNENNGFYDLTGENAFAFKNDALKISRTANNVEYTITGSNQECQKYLEFKVLPVNSDGLIEIEFVSKFDAGNDSVRKGKVIYNNGYQLLNEDGEIFDVEVNEDVTVLSVTIDQDVVDFTKWSIPKYLKTYTAKTVSDDVFNAEDYDKTKNTSQNTEIVMFNDYGTIRFYAKVNVPAVSAMTGDIGGYVEWSGVVETEITVTEDKLLCYVLNCFIISENSLESEGYQNNTKSFSLRWALVHNPSSEPVSAELYKGDSSVFNGVFDSLKTTYNATETANA